MEHSAVADIVLVFVLGISAQWLAWRFNLPAIVLLALTGLAVGPGLGWFEPAAQLGPLFPTLIGLFVAVILFEGGLTLRFHEFRDAGPAVKRLVSVGIAVSCLLGGLAAHFIVGVSWPVAWLFGAITVVTGPTVIMPMLRQARLSRRAASYLKWEGIINDPVGALLAVLLFEYFLYAESGGGLPQVLGGLSSALAATALLGVGVGYLLGKAFYRGYVPEFLKPPIILVMVLFIYELANMAQQESGLLAATLMGITLGNLRLPSILELRRFEEYINILLIATVFIFLTANIDEEVLGLLGWRSLVLLAAMVFVVRPLSVFLATWGSAMDWRERLLVAWIAPRGIVALAISGVVASRMSALGHADAELLVPLVLSLVLLTVLLHGSTIGWLARRLNLASASRSGVLIVGASSLTTDLSRQLTELNVPVILADSSWANLKEARFSGIRVYYGEILSEESEWSLELNEIGFLLAATSNDAYNALVCTHFAPEFDRTNVFQLSMHEAGPKDSKVLSETKRGLAAFGEGVTFEELLSRYYRGWQFQKTRLTNKFAYEDYLKNCPPGTFPLLLVRGDGTVQFHSEQFPIKPTQGDTILSYVPPKPQATPS